ncbi:MAG: glycosyltransferase family 2 protein, partial [Chryseobacterium artocarpi]
RNNLSMMLKNLPFPQLIGLIFFRLCLDGVAGIYFGLKQGFPHLWAVVRAHFGFYRQLPGTWKLRQKHQKIQFYQSKWLIFRHFLGSK